MRVSLLYRWQVVEMMDWWEAYIDRYHSLPKAETAPAGEQQSLGNAGWRELQLRTAAEAMLFLSELVLDRANIALFRQLVSSDLVQGFGESSDEQLLERVAAMLAGRQLVVFARPESDIEASIVNSGEEKQDDQQEPNKPDNQEQEEEKKIEVIPLIFVPGIMGSRLRQRDPNSGDWAWNPDDQMWTAKEYLLLGSAVHKRELLVGFDGFNPEFLVVNEGNEPNNANRGWAGLFGDYGSTRQFLETFSSRLGQDGHGEILKKFEFPVHAFGYNWSDDNRNSGKKLRKFIDGVIALYNKDGKICQKVILLTHSMGGLVARSACRLHGAEGKTIGVIHGVQPATGAAAAYWRMKAGFECTSDFKPPLVDVGLGLSGMALGAISGEDELSEIGKELKDEGLNGLKEQAKQFAVRQMLGANSQQTTALLGNIPGGLELLPNQDYVDNRRQHGWLVLHDGRRLPSRGNPYQEIYREYHAYWRLITPEYLNPFTDPATALAQHKPCLKMAEQFHFELGNYAHPNSFHFYATHPQHLTADRVCYRSESIGWMAQLKEKLLEQLRSEAPQQIDREQWIASKYKEKLKELVKERARFLNQSGAFYHIEEQNGETVKISLLPADGDGDGTVPTSSGSVLANKASQDVNLQGQGEFEHQNTYNHPTAQQFVYDSLKRIVQEYKK